MQQLTGIDASFLYMETPDTPMHVAGLTLYELPPGFSGSFRDHFAAFIESRIHLIPIFRKKLARTVFELDHPGWVDARTIDMAHHIQAVRVPSPAGRAEIEAVVADLHGKALDRSRPLWQFFVLEGLPDNRVGLYSKVHHAAIDGGAGMAIMQVLYDITPTPREVAPPAQDEGPVRKPTVGERAILGVNDFMSNLLLQQVKALAAGAQVAATVASMIAPPKQDKPADAPTDGPRKKGPAIRSLPAVVAPKTPFNASITAERSFAARSLPLADAKIIAKATGTTINDVVMAVASGAIRDYLKARKALPKQPLIAFVPISLRMPGDAAANNQVFGMNCELATELADPIERLLSIRRTSGTSKTFAGAVKDAAPTDFSLLGAPLLLPGLMQLYGRLGIADVAPQAVNIVLSNVPGPQFTLYCAGARVLSLYPVSIPIHGIGLNVTVQSYNGFLDFGLTAGRKVVPDIAVMADRLAPAMEELKAASLAYAKTRAEKEAAKAQAKAAKAAAASTKA